MAGEVNPQLDGLVKPLTWFKTDPKNARVHSKQSIEAIKSSLKRFGQQKPVVALKEGQLVAGHGTLRAAQELGWKGIAVVIFADKKKAAQYAIADNQTALVSTWDFDILSETLTSFRNEGVDIAELGFSDADIKRLLLGFDFEEKRDKDDTVDLKPKLEHKCPRCSYEF